MCKSSALCFRSYRGDRENNALYEVTIFYVLIASVACPLRSARIHGMALLNDDNGVLRSAAANA